jgi:hypothetical protein
VPRQCCHLQRRYGLRCMRSTFPPGAQTWAMTTAPPIERPRQRNLLAGRAGRLPVDLASGNRSRSIHQAAADEIPACLEKRAPASRKLTTKGVPGSCRGGSKHNLPGKMLWGRRRGNCPNSFAREVRAARPPNHYDCRERKRNRNKAARQCPSVANGQLCVATVACHRVVERVSVSAASSRRETVSQG